MTCNTLQRFGRKFVHLVTLFGLLSTLSSLSAFSANTSAAFAQTLPTQDDLPADPGLLQPRMAELAALANVATSSGSQNVDAVSPQTTQGMQSRAFIPVIARGPTSQTLPPAPTDPNDFAAYVNYYRTAAGVPPVTFDATLNNNCWLHSRYMAEENIIAHDEKRDSKWFTAGGLSCAQNGNAWLGGDYVQPYWKPRDAVQGWAGSVGHRMWLLYPTTLVFGFGFYAAANNRAGSALDVLTQFNSTKDAGYANWPVRFPGTNQTGVPAVAYPITLGWAYFGSTPTVSSVSLTAGGKALANSVTTTLPVNHKGIQITPAQALPANTVINVTVNGTYDGKAFTYSWSFTTGS